MSSRSGRVASWRLSFTTSTIFDSTDGDNGTGESDVDYDCDYSVSEVSSSFTFRPSSMLMPLQSDVMNENDDTDIELDDEFNEDTIVTFKPTHETKSRFRKVTVIERPIGLQKLNSNSSHSSHSHHSKCSTLCASTYQASRERKRAQSTIVNPMLPSCHRNVNATSTSDETSASEIDDSSYSQNKTTPTRRKSKFVIKKELEKKVIEGRWKLVGNINFEEYLSEVGTGACTSDMVMRADMVLIISQEEDKQWRLAQETLIKAKSIRGYRTNNRKWTENKFKSGEAKPELLDDWDQRLVVTTLDTNENGSRIILNQVAEKDLFFCKDSTVIYEVEPHDEDVLIMTCMTDSSIAWRKFQRVSQPSKSSRKISAPF